MSPNPLMISNAKVEFVSDNGQAEINVFVHGFGRLKGEDLSGYLLMLRNLRLRGRTYLVNWDSGLLWRPLIPIALVAGGYLAYALYKGLKGEKPAPEQKAKGFLNKALSLGVPAIPLIPVAAGLEFNFSKRRADSLGREFQTILRPIPRVKEEPLNLIGFSLGARMLHTALRTLDWNGYKLKDVCFLGGATDASRHDWQDCVDRIGGYMYNFYSRHDDALKLKPDAEKNIGRNPIPLESPKVVNIETLLHHRRHPSYNEHLKELLQVLGPLPEAIPTVVV